MRFRYSYKTSDNVRHEAEISASDRDAAFTTLREHGIRPIKLLAVDTDSRPSTVKGLVWTICAIILALTFASLGVLLMSSRRSRHETPTAATDHTSLEAYVAYTNLAGQAAELTRKHQDRLDAIGIDLLANYGLVENTSDATFFTSRIKQGYKAIDETRQEVRALFRTLYDIFPPECVKERTDAQRLYVETMDGIDLTEERLANDDKAFRLLNSNRGKWHVIRGKVEWSDTALAREFEFLRRDADPAAVRWRRDFGTSQ